MQSPFSSEYVCRGSVALGSGCRRCARCRAEIAAANAQQAALGQEDAFQLEMFPVKTETTTIDPSKAVVTGLPVAGYKQEAWKVDLVNMNKKLEETILRQIDFHATGPMAHELNQRDVQMARGLIEDAFMRLNRGVFQPQRLQGDL